MNINNKKFLVIFSNFRLIYKIKIEIVFFIN